MASSVSRCLYCLREIKYVLYFKKALRNLKISRGGVGCPTEVNCTLTPCTWECIKHSAKQTRGVSLEVDSCVAGSGPRPAFVPPSPRSAPPLAAAVPRLRGNSRTTARAIQGQGSPHDARNCPGNHCARTRKWGAGGERLS